MKMPKAVKILVFEDSRKAGFALWGLVISTTLTLRGALDPKWIECFMICVFLIGGGTLADKYLQIKKDKADATAKAKASE